MPIGAGGECNMKKNKMWFWVISVLALFVLMACGNDDDGETPASEGDDTGLIESGEDDFGLDENGRFIEPVTISVLLWQRDNDRMPVLAESYWADWIAARMLEERNIIIEWETIGRWSEGTDLSNLIGAQMAPDVSFTFSQPNVESFASWGGVHNLMDYLPRYRQFLDNLYGFLNDETDALIYHNLDPVTNELWSITGRNAVHGRVNTWIREDWLDALDLPVPTTFEEFEAALYAFQERSDELTGLYDTQVIPYMTGQDVAWDMQTLIESFIPSDITDREWFIYDFDDRRFMHEDAVREATRVFNQWFNDGLIWEDFIIAETAAGHDQVRLGNVGAFTGNWDFPFRAGEAFQTTMRENIGEDATFIPIQPFLNDTGSVQSFLPNPTDRFIFFPSTNENILASLMYLDFMSRADTLLTIQLGFEGTHWTESPDGTITFIEDTEENPWPDNQLFAGGFNFDIALLANGVSDLDILFYSYAGIPASEVERARTLNLENERRFASVSTRSIEAESGMAEVLADARDVLLHTVIAANPSDFDTVWESEFETYMNLGARAIIEERTQAWYETFGDSDVPIEAQ